MQDRRRLAGMTGFTLAWFGQIISLLGTAMSTFALTLWVYDQTGEATPLTRIGFFFILPQVVLVPLVGVLVDRFNRKLMMVVSDAAAGLVSLLVLILFTTGNLQIWHLYLCSFVSGLAQSFQWPAYSAAISLMLPKEQYARANGMMMIAGDGSRILAPLLAGALYVPLGLGTILIIDLLTAGLAVGAMLFVHVPQPEQSEAGREGTGNLLHQAVYGFRYILARPSLLGLQSVFLVANLFTSLGFAIHPAMILARSGNDQWALSIVESAAAIGGVAGALLMSAWGGPRRRVDGVLVGWFLFGLTLGTLTGLGRTLPFWAVGAFLGLLFAPILDGCNQTIWQSKVPPDVQGRVFTARQFIAWMAMPLANLIAGPLADRVMEPAMAEGGKLVPAFGWMVGTGSGAGMALLFLVTNLLAALGGIAGYLFPVISRAEALLPDHDQASSNRRHTEDTQKAL